MVSVLLCIQTRIYRDGLIGALAGRDEFAEVSACSSLAELHRMLDCMRTDAILIDLRIEHNGTSSVSEERNAYRIAAGRSLVVLGADQGDELVADLFEAGVDGCVTTNDSIDDLVRVLGAVAQGELCCPPQVARTLKERLARLSAGGARESRVGKLSRRELEVRAC